MRPIFYARNRRQPCRAEYGIVMFRNRLELAQAWIVVVWRRSALSGTSLYNAYDGVDSILNRILSAELEGVRLDCIRMFLVQDYTDEREQGPYHRFDAIEVPIRFNLRDWVERWQPPGVLQRLGNPFRRKVTWQAPSDRAVAGSVACSTDPNQFRSLKDDEIDALFDAIGYRRQRQAVA